MAILSSTSLDTSVISEIADAVVTLMGKVVTMVTSNPLLFLGIGIGLFGMAIGLVRRFL